MLKIMFHIPNRSLRPVVLLTAGLCLAFIAIACSSGNGGGRQTEDLPPVIFLADKDTVGTVELYVSLNGGADIKKLSGAMILGGNVVDFKISPDGLQVAYVANQLDVTIFELFVSPVDGSAVPAAPVSGAMAGSGIATDTGNPNRYSFDWSANSQRIAYRAAQDLADAIELYTVRPDGTDNEKLHPDFIAGQNVVAFAWAPNASRVAYTANQSLLPPAAIELYTSFPSGVFNTRVSGDLVNGGNVDRFLWAPNSARIAYRADQITVDQFELFVTRPNQDLFDRVSFPLTALGDVRIDYAWAPDSSRLAYRADLVDDILLGSDKLGLFTATPEGTLGLRASGGVVPGGSFGVIAFQWAPDSSLLTYVSDQNVLDQFDLFVTTLDIVTPLPVKLSVFSAVGGDVTSSEWSPNSLRVAFIADQSVLSRSELFTGFRTGTGVPLLISNLLDTESDVENFIWSPNSTLIAYRADQNTDGVIELYTAPPTGTFINSISDTAATGGQVQQFLWEPGGAGIGYIADQDTGGRFELYLSLPDGSDGEKVSGLLVAGGSVRRFEWVP